MAVNKLAIAHERAKMGLKSKILQARVTIADNQSKLKSHRSELKAMQNKKPSTF
jgi:hypothetical protein